MARQQHMKLSDVLARPGFFTGPRVRFVDAFPTIDEITVEIDMDGIRPFGAYGGVRVFDKSNIEPAYDCPNPQCTRGGIRLESLISQMVCSRETSKEFQLKCEGYEGSPKGKRYYRTCTNWYKVKISIRYKGIVASSENH